MQSLKDTSKKYTGHGYYTVPDDGAPHKCSSCEQHFSHKQVKLCTPLPDDYTARAMLCLDCIDEWWLSTAKYLGEA